VGGPRLKVQKRKRRPSGREEKKTDEAPFSGKSPGRSHPESYSKQAVFLSRGERSRRQRKKEGAARALYLWGKNKPLDQTASMEKAKTS